MKVKFSEAINEEQTTVRYRVGNGRERTFILDREPVSGECAYTLATATYSCTYKPTAGEAGLFQVKVSAYQDTSGNAGTPGSYHTWGITVDTNAPAAPMLVLKHPASSPGQRRCPGVHRNALGGRPGRLVVWRDRANCGDFVSRKGVATVNDNTPPYTADVTTGNLRTDGSYTYYVLHMDNHFNRSPCVAAFTYVYDGTPPAKPDNFMVERDPGYATLTWNDPSDPTIAKYQYRQYRTNEGKVRLRRFQPVDRVDGHPRQRRRHHRSYRTRPGPPPRLLLPVAGGEYGRRRRHRGPRQPRPPVAAVLELWRGDDPVRVPLCQAEDYLPCSGLRRVS